MANVDISLVTLSNTFDEWRTRTNDVISDRNVLRNANYVKDEGNLLVSNGTLRITKSSGGTTFTNDYDALISGTLTSNVMVSVNPTGIGLQVTAATQLNGNVNVAQSLAVTRNVSVSNVLTVSGSSVLANANVSGYLNVNSYIDATGNINAYGNLLVSKVGYFTGNVVASANIGINTAAPKSRLHVLHSAVSGGYTLYNTGAGGIVHEGSASVDSGLEFATDRTSTSTIAFTDQDAAARGRISFAHGTDNLFVATAGNLIINAGGSEKFRLLADGNVGIGTATPIYPLDTNAGRARLGQTVFSTFTLRNSLGNAIVNNDALNPGTTQIGTGGASPGNITFHSTSTMAAGDERARIDAGGNLLIGTVLSTYNGRIVSYGAAGNNIVVVDNTTGSAISAPRIGSSADNLVFSTAIAGIAAAERMRITPQGNVGIGTTAPTANLHVAGSALITGGLTLSGNTTLDAGTLFVDSVNDRVGISTITPAYKLHVNGQLYAASGGILDLDTEQLLLRTITNSNKQLILGYVNSSDSSVITSIQQGTGYKDLNIAASNVIFKSGVTEIGRVSSTGLGIGIAIPSDKLQVTGGNLIVGTTNERLTHEFDTTNRIGRIAAKSAASAATLTLGTTQSGVYKDSVYVDYNGNVAFGNVSALIGSSAGVAANSNVSVRIIGDNPALYISDQRAAVRQASIQMETLGGSWSIENNNDFVIKNQNPGGPITTGSFLNLGRTTGPLLLGTNGLERARIDVTGNVAVGRTDPTFKFDVNSTITNLARFYYADGTNNPRLQITASLNDGITLDETFTTGASNLMFAIAGSEKVRITTGGNIGIGNSNPVNKLDIANPGSITARIWNTTSSADASYFATNSVGTAQFGINATGMYNYTGSAIPALFYTNATERMRIDAAGLVGIGTNAPAANLHVIGSGILSANVGSSDVLTLRNTDTGMDGRATLRFTSDRVTSNSWTMGIDVAGGVNKSFQIRDTSVSGAPIRFTIKSDGNVGLGTQNNPGYKLDIADAATVTARVLNTASTDAVFRAESTTGVAQFGLSSTGMQLFTPSAIPALFFTNNTERMRITATGTIGVGTTTPGTNLDIQGASTTVDGRIYSTATGGKAKLFVRGDTTNMSLESDGTAGTSMLFDNVNGHQAFTYTVGASGNWKLFTAGSERFRIDQTGNVGIGTTSPASALHINNPSAAGDTPRIRFTNTNTGTTAGDGSFVGLSNQNQLDIWNQEASVVRIGTNNLERIRVDETGNVGIATSGFTPTLGLQYNTYFGVTSGAVTLWGQDVRSASQTNAGILSWSTGNVLVGSATATTNVNFVTGASTLRAKIDATTGNFGINTTSPAYTLDVNGTANVASVIVGNITLESTGSLTTTAVTTVDLNTYLKTSYRTAKYLIQAVSGTTVHTTEVQLMHDGTTTYMTEYATMKNGANLFTVTSDINVNDVRLRITPASATSTTFKFHRISITA